MSLFNTDTRHKEINGRLWHLGDVITHTKSENRYEIKEIQANGIIVYFVNNPKFDLAPAKELQKYYISESELNEYC